MLPGRDRFTTSLPFRSYANRPTYRPKTPIAMGIAAARLVSIVRSMASLDAPGLARFASSVPSFVSRPRLDSHQHGDIYCCVWLDWCAVVQPGCQILHSVFLPCNVFFGFLTSVFNEGCKTYIDSAAFLKQSSYPKFIFVLRVVWRNLLLLAHQIPLILIVLWIGGLLGQSLWLLWLGGMLLTVASAVMAVALLGAISTRFRDIPMGVGSILQIAFFITPVIWRPTQLSAGHSSTFIALNPLAAWLELLRAPLMGQAPQITAWVTASIAFVVLTLLCIAVYLAVRRRINYWL